MRRIGKILTLFAFIILSAMLTACGAVEEPTFSMVESVLQSKEFIPDSNANEDNSATRPSDYYYDLEVDSCVLKDGNKTAVVQASFTEGAGPMEQVTKYELTFRLKDDGRSWNTNQTSVKLISGPTSKLVHGLWEFQADELISAAFFTVGDKTFYSDNISKVKISDEKGVLNPEAMTYSTGYHIRCEQKMYATEFDVMATFKYVCRDNLSGSWKFDSAVVDESSVVQTYSTSYKRKIDTEALADYIHAKDMPFYVFGEDYSTRSDDIKIKNVVCADKEVDGEKDIIVPTTFDVVIADDLTVSFDADIWFHFSKQWEPYYIENPKIGAISGKWSGTWFGTMHDGVDHVSIQMTDEFNEYGYPKVYVEIISDNKEIGTYSWVAQLSEYKPLKDHYQKVDFVSWDNLPLNNDEFGYDEFSGSVQGGSWISDDDWQPFEFIKMG